ncbi:MAG: phage major tail protein, TP901-1 family [Minwuia sp.]|nr:phage major tail protein, TP901-1 family [Minwuia sp.]
MAAQAGAALLLKISNGDSPETFATIGGLRSPSFSHNKQAIDITDQQSTGRWREYLGAVATQSVGVSGSGVFTDDGAGDTALKNAAIDAAAMINFQIVIPDFGTFEGPFHVTSLEYSGEHEGAVEFSVSLESGGVIAFTAA